MGTEVLEVSLPDELVMWLYLAESEVSMEQGEAGIILDYLKEQVQNRNNNGTGRV
ncbi:MAG: hypothetical protein HFH37_09585 [Lachnospiraceae bacterium]|nr:hypothetical protein [Lachnospiraceae bacterium]